MNKSRTEALTDGVIAIIMTLLVLGLKIPTGDSFRDLWALKESFATYIISFFLIGITWHNHHHMFQLAEKVNGRVIWMNTLLLFSLSLFPFATNWVGVHLTSLVPEICYGVVFLLTDFCYFLLNQTLVLSNGPDSKIYKALYKDKKIPLTLAINVLAIIAGFFYPPLVIIISFFILIIWFIPNKLVEKNY
ncbi:MAG: TMEM175 family protein [Sarcina sp.]